MPVAQEATQRSLKSRFEDFILTVPRLLSIDALLSGVTNQNNDRADYLAQESRLIVELKSLEENTEWKVEKILAPHRHREEFPVFFDKWEIGKVLKHLPDGDQLHNQIVQRITTSVRADFRKANNQIRFTKKSFDIPEAQGLLIILNENLEILSTDLILRTLQTIALSKLESGGLRYTEIQAVLLLSEAHGRELPNRVLGFPATLMKLEGREKFLHDDFINVLSRGWAEFNQAQFVQAENTVSSFNDLGFVGVSALHDAERTEVTPQEAWIRYYNWNPYFRNFDEDGLKWVCRMIMFEFGRGFIKGGTKQESERAQYFWIEVFTHFIEEVNYRGIDIRTFTGDERSSQELDALMKSRFSDFVPPDRSWVKQWRGKAKKSGR